MKKLFKKALSLCLLVLIIFSVAPITQIKASALTEIGTITTSAETESNLIYHRVDLKENPDVKDVTSKVVDLGTANSFVRYLPDGAQTQIKFYIKQASGANQISSPIYSQMPLSSRVKAPEGCKNWKCSKVAVCDTLKETDEMVEYYTYYCAGCLNEEQNNTVTLKTAEIKVKRDNAVDYHINNTPLPGLNNSLNSLIDKEDHVEYNVSNYHMYCESKCGIHTKCENNYSECKENGCLSKILYHENPCTPKLTTGQINSYCPGHRVCLGYIATLSKPTMTSLSVNYIGEDVIKYYLRPSKQTFTAEIGVNISDILSINNCNFNFSYTDLNGDSFSQSIPYSSSYLSFSEFDPFKVGLQKVTVTYKDKASTYIYINLDANVYSVCNFQESTAFYDSENNFFYNFTPGINNVKDAVVPAEGFTIKMTNYGTGASINFYHNNTKVLSVPMVIIGDVNEDGWYDKEDAEIVKRIINSGLTEADFKTEPWIYKAADANRDNKVDMKDVELLNKADIALAGVNKNDPSKTQALYDNYCELMNQGMSQDNNASTGSSFLQKIIDLIYTILHFLMPNRF